MIILLTLVSKLVPRVSLKGNSYGLLQQKESLGTRLNSLVSMKITDNLVFRKMSNSIHLSKFFFSKWSSKTRVLSKLDLYPNSYCLNKNLVGSNDPRALERSSSFDLFPILWKIKDKLFCYNTLKKVVWIKLSKFLRKKC